MKLGILEIVGLFLVVVGCGAIVAAASMWSIALAVLVAGLFLVLGGVLVAYAAAVSAQAAGQGRPGGEPR
ncbi:MAG TPA: hypothetical protein VGF17_20790 [Phytomonospora sp.]